MRYLSTYRGPKTWTDLDPNPQRENYERVLTVTTDPLHHIENIITVVRKSLKIASRLIYDPQASLDF